MPSKEDIVHCPYSPVCLSDANAVEARLKKERSGKTYATVGLDNENPHHRGKRGEVIDRHESDGKMMNLLKIDTVNFTWPDGHRTLMGVSESGYSEVLFSDDELSNFETYDLDGEPV